MTEVNATPNRAQHETTATLAANRHGCARGAAQSLLTPPLRLAGQPVSSASAAVNETKIPSNCRRGVFPLPPHNTRWWQPRRIHPVLRGEDFQRLIPPRLHAVVSELV